MTTTGNIHHEHIVIVRGIAKSKYARSAPKYEKDVKVAALAIFGKPLSTRDLSVEVRHFYTSGNTVDLDNLLKSILDGLKGAAYHDDGQIAYVCARRYNISISYAVENLRSDEVDLLAEGRDFVEIIVSQV